MTVKQRQHLLAYLGYYVGNVDGDWGTLSKTACTAFQKDFGGIRTDGFGGPETDKALRHAVAYDMFKPEPVPEEPVDNGMSADNNESNPGNNGTTTADNGTFWDEIEFFTRNEPGIACPCGRCGGFPVEPVERLMRNADAVRKHFGKPMIPSSTVRCAAHNAELPDSAANSLHMRGKAMDFAIPGVSAAALEAYVRTLPDVHECYQIDGSYVHMGVQKY